MNWGGYVFILFMFVLGYWTNYSHEKTQGRIHNKKESLLWGLFFAVPCILVALISIVTYYIL